MSDEFTFTLDNPLTEEQWDMITDVEFESTESVWFHTKHGKDIEFAKVKHGKWIVMKEFDPKIRANYIRIKCSECNTKIADDWEGKQSIRTALNYQYCPYCGAKNAKLIF